MLNLDAAYNGSTEAYRADLKVDALQLHHFLPKDSIYELTTSVAAVGRGIDFTSYRTTLFEGLTAIVALWALSDFGN